MSDKILEHSSELSVPVGAPPPTPAPKRSRKPKAETHGSLVETSDPPAPKAPAKLAEKAEKATKKPNGKPQSTAPKTPPRQAFLEALLELHSCLAETAMTIDKHWGKALAKFAPYDEGPEGDGDEDAIDLEQ